MPVWKKNNTSSWKQSLFIIILLSWSHVVNSKPTSGIDIKHASGTLNKDTYYVDAYIQYQFSEETQEALEHGIALQIDINLDVKKQRKWLWDKKIKSTTMSYRLEHHPLSGHYQVTNLNNYHRKHFQNIQGALSSLGLIKNFPLFNTIILMPDSVYIAQIKAKLNIQTLPAPLRLLAYVSSNWHLASPWYEWVIQQ